MKPEGSDLTLGKQFLTVTRREAVEEVAQVVQQVSTPGGFQTYEKPTLNAAQALL